MVCGYVNAGNGRAKFVWVNLQRPRAPSIFSRQTYAPEPLAILYPRLLARYWDIRKESCGGFNRSQKKCRFEREFSWVGVYKFPL
jgi:hypothetical protein